MKKRYKILIVLLCFSVLFSVMCVNISAYTHTDSDGTVYYIPDSLFHESSITEDWHETDDFINSNDSFFASRRYSTAVSSAHFYFSSDNLNFCNFLYDCFYNGYVGAPDSNFSVSHVSSQTFVPRITHDNLSNVLKYEFDLVGHFSSDNIPDVKLSLDSYYTEYNLVTDISELNPGDRIIIVYSTDNDSYVMSTQAENNRNSIKLDQESAEYCEPVGDYDVFTLGLDDSGFYTLHDGDGYLYAASSSSNYLKTKSDLDSKGLWEISFDNGNASIVSQGVSRNSIRYNSSSNLFSCYSSTSTMKHVRIYKESINFVYPFEIDPINRFEIFDFKNILSDSSPYRFLYSVSDDVSSDFVYLRASFEIIVDPVSKYIFVTIVDLDGNYICKSLPYRDLGLGFAFHLDLSNLEYCLDWEYVGFGDGFSSYRLLPTGTSLESYLGSHSFKMYLDRISSNSSFKYYDDYFTAREHLLFADREIENLKNQLQSEIEYNAILEHEKNSLETNISKLETDISKLETDISKLKSYAFELENSNALDELFTGTSQGILTIIRGVADLGYTTTSGLSVTVGGLLVVSILGAFIVFVLKIIFGGK